jgi:type II secretory pathway component PulJ
MKECPKCNAQLKDDDIFCWQCGEDFRNSAVVAEKDKEKQVSLEKLKSGLVAVIIIASIALIGWIVTGVNGADTIDRINSLEQRNNELSNTISSLERTKNGLNDEIKSLQSTNNALVSIASVRVTSIKVGNWNNGRWITEPGGQLYASQFYRIGPRISYKSTTNQAVRLDIKIYYPSENTPQRWSEDAASGYTWSENATLSSSGGTYDLKVWGWDKPGNLWPGNYKIEVWYNNVCLWSDIFRLN